MAAAIRAPARLNRIRLQYSLRSLLLLVTLTCVFLAWFGPRYRAACEQRAAVAGVRGLGANVYYDYEHHADRPWPTDGSGVGPSAPPGPAWARRLLGIDFFADAVEVRFGIDDRMHCTEVGRLPFYAPIPGRLPGGYLEADAARISRFWRDLAAQEGRP